VFVQAVMGLASRLPGAGLAPLALALSVSFATIALCSAGSTLAIGSVYREGQRSRVGLDCHGPGCSTASAMRLRGGGWLSKAADMMSSAAAAAALLVSPTKTKAAQAEASPLQGVHKPPAKFERRGRQASLEQSPLKSAVSPTKSGLVMPAGSNLTRTIAPRRIFVQPPFTLPDDTSVETMLKSMPGWTTDGKGTFTADVSWRPGMRIPARFWASKDTLRLLVIEYLKNHARESAGLPWPGGFLPGVIQLAQVAHLPGAVGHSMGMPDIHSGYGFAIGGVAAMDLDNNESVVSPGGVGFDINCGVRLLKTNLKAEDVMPVKEQLADMLFKMVPVGVGEGSCLGRISIEEQDEIMRKGMKWCEEQGYCWPSDREHVEEGGSFEGADPSVVSPRCKKRGLQQCGSLGLFSLRQ